MRAVAGPFEAPGGAGERRLRPGGAGELADRLAQGFGEPLGALQQGSPRREAILLAGLHRQRVEFGEVVAQQILLLSACGGKPGSFLFAPQHRPPIPPGLGHRRSTRMFGESVEDHPMIGGIEQAALLELALDFDQTVAELAQQTDARRLVIDKGPAAAVAAHQPAQHDRLAIAVEPGFAQDRIGRMVLPDREFGADRGFAGAVAHEPRFDAFSQRQPQRIEQDRLSRPGLAGQDA